MTSSFPGGDAPPSVFSITSGHFCWTTPFRNVSQLEDFVTCESSNFQRWRAGVDRSEALTTRPRRLLQNGTQSHDLMIIYRINKPARCIHCIMKLQLWTCDLFFKISTQGALGLWTQSEVNQYIYGFKGNDVPSEFHSHLGLFPNKF